MNDKEKTEPKVAKKEKTLTKEPGEILVRMKIDDTHEWNFKASGAYDALEQGMSICRDAGFKFRQDVTIWEFS